MSFWCTVDSPGQRQAVSNWPIAGGTSCCACRRSGPRSAEAASTVRLHVNCCSAALLRQCLPKKTLALHWVLIATSNRDVATRSSRLALLHAGPGWTTSCATRTALSRQESQCTPHPLIPMLAAWSARALLPDTRQAGRPCFLQHTKSLRLEASSRPCPCPTTPLAASLTAHTAHWPGRPRPPCKAPARRRQARGL